MEKFVDMLNRHFENNNDPFVAKGVEVNSSDSKNKELPKTIIVGIGRPKMDKIEEENNMKHIGICYRDDTREILIDALDDMIVKLEKIRRNPGEISPEELPGIFHYHTGIDGYIEDVKSLRNELSGYDETKLSK